MHRLAIIMQKMHSIRYMERLSDRQLPHEVLEPSRTACREQFFDVVQHGKPWLLLHTSFSIPQMDVSASNNYT